MSKSKRQKVMEESREDVNGVLERLKEIAAIAAAEPYLTDAAAMLTQGVAFLEKQLVSEFDWKPPEVAQPKPEPGTADEIGKINQEAIERHGREKAGRMEKKAAAK